MTLERLAELVTERARAPRSGSLLAALSGIDGSGKTTCALELARALEARGVRCALIHLDAWHEPPSTRFGGGNPPAHFYAHAFRFAELFALLVEPLRRARAIHLDVELTRPDNDRFMHRYDFVAIDVILLEGIFLLKRELAAKSDLSIWIECSFETALGRVLRRNQEGLPAAELRRAFETLYFPAQRIHLARDEPRAAATLVMPDARLRGALPVLGEG